MDTTRNGMTDAELAERLRDAIYEAEAIDQAEGGEGTLSGMRASTFQDAGVMSLNAGLVVSIGDREFQITVVRSR
jgi:hypothetical protein